MQVSQAGTLAQGLYKPRDQFWIIAPAARHCVDHAQLDLFCGYATAVVWSAEQTCAVAVVSHLDLPVLWPLCGLSIVIRTVCEFWPEWAGAHTGAEIIGPYTHLDHLALPATDLVMCFHGQALAAFAAGLPLQHVLAHAAHAALEEFNGMLIPYGDSAAMMGPAAHTKLARGLDLHVEPWTGAEMLLEIRGHQSRVTPLM